MFELFNVGEDPAFGPPHPRGVDYRRCGNRSLSVGDVVAVDGRFYACASTGWAALKDRPLIDQPLIDGQDSRNHPSTRLRAEHREPADRVLSLSRYFAVRRVERGSAPRCGPAVEGGQPHSGARGTGVRRPAGDLSIRLQPIRSRQVRADGPGPKPAGRNPRRPLRGLPRPDHSAADRHAPGPHHAMTAIGWATPRTAIPQCRTDP